MDRTTYYREIVQKIIMDWEHLLKKHPAPGVEVYHLFDPQQDHYALGRRGYNKGEGRVNFVIIYVTIREGCVRVEEDGTEDGIANRLLEHGIPADDIVLGFNPPGMQKPPPLAVA